MCPALWIGEHAQGSVLLIVHQFQGGQELCGIPPKPMCPSAIWTDSKWPLTLSEHAAIQSPVCFLGGTLILAVTRLGSLSPSSLSAPVSPAQLLPEDSPMAPDAIPHNSIVWSFHRVPRNSQQSLQRVQGLL